MTAAVTGGQRNESDPMPTPRVVETRNPDMLCAQKGRRLLWHGAFLFLLGLLTGLVTGLLQNPRMGHRPALRRRPAPAPRRRWSACHGGLARSHGPRLRTVDTLLLAAVAIAVAVVAASVDSLIR